MVANGAGTIRAVAIGIGVVAIEAGGMVAVIMAVTITAIIGVTRTITTIRITTIRTTPTRITIPSLQVAIR
jgi:hypothetical protein